MTSRRDCLPSLPFLPSPLPAQHLMNELEEISDKKHNGYFVDLFVRVTNLLAINMYKKFGYSVYRCIPESPPQTKTLNPKS